jgi:hypothetical protein
MKFDTTVVTVRLLRERVGQPCLPAHIHPDYEVLALDAVGAGKAHEALRPTTTAAAAVQSRPIRINPARV